MNVDLAEYYVGKLSDAIWVGRIAGLVRLYEKRYVDTDGRTYIRRYPIACNILDPSKCGDNDFMMPDAKQKSVIWFEDFGSDYQKKEARAVHYKSHLRMVVWLNLKFFDHSNCSMSAAVFQDVVSRFITGASDNLQGYQRIHAVSVSEEQKQREIFARYNFEHEAVYHYPYDYFAIRITTDFSINHNCKPEIIPVTPDDCP